MAQSTLDRDKLADCGFISIHAQANGPTEQALRGAGFGIPEYPNQGPITYEGRQVGHAANFNGLCFQDKDLVWQLRELFNKLPFWYTN